MLGQRGMGVEAREGASEGTERGNYYIRVTHKLRKEKLWTETKNYGKKCN